MTTELDQNATQATTNQAAPATQPAAPAITPEIQAMIDAARAEGRNSGAADARRAIEGKIRGQAPQPAQPQPSPPQATHPDAPSDYKLMRLFDRTISKFDLSDEALTVVEEDFARANPSDPVTWVTSRANAYGWRPRGAAQPATSTQSPATPASPPSPMPGSTPPATPVLTSDTPIMTILRSDPSQVDRLAAQLGPRKFSERLHAEWNAVALRVPVKR